MTCTPLDFSRTFVDEADCRRQSERSCRLTLAMPGTGDSATRRAQCADLLDAQSCPEYRQAQPDVCGAPPGTTPVGAPCYTSTQCQAGNYCDILMAGRCGTCKPQVADGQACGGLAFQCKTGSACLFAAGLNGVCVSTTKEGGACGGTTNAICAANTVCRNSVCTVVAGYNVGDPCTGMSSAECDTRIAQCNRLTMTCEALLMAKAGENCGGLVDGSGLSVSCVSGTSCVATVGAFARTCLPDLPFGSACDVQIGARCVRPSTCSEGKCQIVPPPTCP
jgi:hypothetical protein